MVAWVHWMLRDIYLQKEFIDLESMKKFKWHSSFLFLFYISCDIYSQDFSSQVPGVIKYDPKVVIDSSYGITIYEKLCPLMGGDSVRNDKKGYAVQGWMEDYFVTDKIMHKGYYVDGALQTYKNFYESGQVERMYRAVDYKRCDVFVFYEDGKQKAEVHYYNKNLSKEIDYYDNGNINSVEENYGDNEYLIRRNSYFSNGNAQILFELQDKKKKLYVHREYFQNGAVREDGMLIYSFDKLDYVKDGIWKKFDKDGTLVKTEKFQNGELMD